jgi:hypothetical protein
MAAVGDGAFGEAGGGETLRAEDGETLTAVNTKVAKAAKARTFGIFAAFVFNTPPSAISANSAVKIRT